MATYPSRVPLHDPDWDEGLDPEGPSAEDLDRFGDEFRTCPRCGEQIYDQAEICPHCRQGIIEPTEHFPWWVWVGMVFAILAFLLILI